MPTEVHLLQNIGEVKQIDGRGINQVNELLETGDWILIAAAITEYTTESPREGAGHHGETFIKKGSSITYIL